MVDAILIAGGFYDIAVRAIVMGIFASCLARLSVLVPVRATRRAPGFATPAEARP